MPTRDLAKLSESVWRKLELIESATEREILANFRAVLEDTRKGLGRIFEKYATGGVLTRAEMTKYNRLYTLERQLVESLGPTLSTNGKLINRLSATEYHESFFRHAWAIEQSAGVALKWGPLPKTMIKAAVENELRELALTGLKQEALTGIRRTVVQGLTTGASYPQMAKDMKKFLERSASGYLRVAQTEAHKAMVYGQLDNYAEAERLGLKLRRIWVATMDDRTRPSHAEMDGVAADENGLFDTSWGVVDGPGQGPAEEVINCLPGDAIIAGRPEIVYRRWYTGELITIATVIGTRLSVTPNHPILTFHGWLPAKSIHKGDHIICGRFRKPMTFIDINIQRMPASIKKVFDTISQPEFPKRVPGTNTQFHGDGMDGDVDVIFANRELRFTNNSAIAKPFDELLLTLSDYSATSLGAQNEFFLTAFHSANSGMGSFRETDTFGGTSICHSGEHGLTTVADGNPGFTKNTLNDLPTNMETLGELFDRDGLIGIENCEVISIDASNFSGHVYNLQTKDGYYYAQNPESVNGNMFITHNCRCRVVADPDEENMDPGLQQKQEETVVQYQKYNTWANEQGIKIME